MKTSALKPLVFGIICFLIVCLTREELASLRKEGGGYVYVAPSRDIVHLTFGYDLTLADSLWIRAIQDFDICENRVDESELGLGLSSDIPSEEFKDELGHLFQSVESLNKGRKVCRKGWVFRMLDAVTELDPRFKVVYRVGATSLSVMLDDYEGASVLYEKGVRQYPKDWNLAYYAAYHFMFDKKDMKRGGELLELALENGAPEWVGSLAARAYTAAGQGEMALRMLLHFRQFTKNELRGEVDRRIQRLREFLINPQDSKENSQ